MEEFEQTLEAVRVAVERGVEIELESSDPGRDQYRLRRALKATEIYRTECNGRFAGLGELVSLSTKAGRVVVSPRGGAQRLKAVRVTEHDALRYLEGYKGSGPIFEFHPTDSFNEEEFKSEVQRLGYEMVALQEGIEGEGTLRVGALRKEKRPSVWDQLDNDDSG